MQMFRYLIYMIVALASVGHSFAQTVDAVGTAIIYNGDITDARYRATQQAIKQAVLQSSSRVSVNDILNNGELNSDLKIRSAGRVQHAKIISETQKGDFLTVVARINVTADYMCSNGATNYYRKSVAITGFALEHRQQASLGALGNISRELPKDFADAINKQGFLRALAATNIALYPDNINAPSLTNNNDTLTDVVRVAQKLGTQYVVSGVIRDIAPLYMRRPNDPYASTDDKSEKQRDFVLDIYIYDGFSGALLFQKRYSEIGNWDISDHAKVGFGSAQFWTTHYGRVVKETLRESAIDTSEKLRCQPFMANIFRTEGKQIHIAAGSVSGVKAGDKFKVYRRYEIFDQDQKPETQLNNANISVTITQVQPNFSIGELSVDAKILNVQPHDVVIAW